MRSSLDITSIPFSQAHLLSISSALNLRAPALPPAPAPWLQTPVPGPGLLPWAMILPRMLWLPMARSTTADDREESVIHRHCSTSLNLFFVVVVVLLRHRDAELVAVRLAVVIAAVVQSPIVQMTPLLAVAAAAMLLLAMTPQPPVPLAQ
ncbi:hypothetical protein F4809DRAFT_553674 [Biscogniauxia mediterranea]|nr:hypothetical protein F4809DRAFT_553674 [Biscogniauxia mediterranea]